MGLEKFGGPTTVKQVVMFDNIFKSHGHMSEKDILLTILAEVRAARGEFASEFHFLNSKISHIMGQFEDFTAALDKLDTDISAVATELGNIASQTPTGALTADQAASLLARIVGEQTKLEALAVPPVVAPPAETPAV